VADAVAIASSSVHDPGSNHVQNHLPTIGPQLKEDLMRTIALILALMLFGLHSPIADAASARKLQRESDRVLDKLYEAKPSTRAVLASAAGVLVFPGIYKGGIGVGAEYGEGVLREGGRVTGYFRIVSGTVGLQLGLQKRAQIIAFMNDEALRKFKNSDGWEAGVDGSVVLADLGAGAQADTKSLNQPIIGFILDGKGLMYNATLEGTKITRIEK
jgi:lipid-binding SYLF domain-containing protein